LVPDGTLQAGPPALQQATIANVESFFGWTVSSDQLIDSLGRING
jgi:ureidoacrylate peracid hydrolase